MSEMGQGVVGSSPIIAQIIYVLSLKKFQLVVRTEYALAIPIAWINVSVHYIAKEPAFYETKLL